VFCSTGSAFIFNAGVWRAASGSSDAGIYDLIQIRFRKTRQRTIMFRSCSRPTGIRPSRRLTTAGGEVTAVISVGGFLSFGEKMAEAPLSHVDFEAGKPIMPGGD
jgi:hypothetical protein